MRCPATHACCCCARVISASRRRTSRGRSTIGRTTKRGRANDEITQSEHVTRSGDDSGLEAKPKFAAEDLRAALDEADDPHVLLVALRRVAEARGRVAKVAKAAGIERESLYRALSARGN